MVYMQLFLTGRELLEELFKYKTINEKYGQVIARKRQDSNQFELSNLIFKVS